MKPFHLFPKLPDRLILGMMIFLGMMAFPDRAFAQISPDRTLGHDRSVVERNQVLQEEPTVLITGGRQAGANLFHSFREFNVGNRQQVYFANPTGIETILTRVTGNNASQIRGTLGVDGAANLFLLNPNGIIFGENAALDVSGSFLATTADSIVFNDNIQFRADGSQSSSLLKVSVPIGLQFGSAPGDITNQSLSVLEDSIGNPLYPLEGRYVGLRVPPERTLALVGGNITLAGDLTASGGQIELGSIAGSGQVRLTQLPDHRGWVLAYDGIQRFGDIELFQADVNANGVGGGDIQIQGDRILVSDLSEIRARTLGSQNGRGIFIRAAQFTLEGGSQISTSTLAEGQGGNISIIASDFVELTDVARDYETDQPIDDNYQPIVNPVREGDNEPLPSGLFARVSGSRATGRGGNISISTDRLSILAGAQVSTSVNNGQSPAGQITVRASDIELSGVTLLADGEPIRRDNGALFPSTLSTFTDSDNPRSRSGDITIETESLRVQDGATIQTSTQGRGDAGNLQIDASELIDIAGSERHSSSPEGLLTFSGGIPELNILGEPDATGRGGTLRITTGNLVVREGAVAAVGSQNATAEGAGNLQIQAENILLEDQGQLTAATRFVRGGNINLQVEDLLVLRRGSNISASAGSHRTPGDGGNITINSNFIVAMPYENSNISANAFQGNGGRVDITQTQGIFGIEFREQETLFSDITVSSTFGEPGTVTINSPEVDPSRGLVQLPDTPVSSQPIQGCQVEGDVASAEFFNTGRGGIPASPYEPLSESAVLDDVRLPVPPNSANQANASPVALVDRPIEAQGWVMNDRSQVVLVAEIPANPLQNRCHLR